MISFEIRYDESLAKWQHRGAGRKNWSKPMKLGELQKVLQHEVAGTPLPVNSQAFAEQWSLPVAHKPRSKTPEREKLENLYEISGGKVQRIASSAKEREAQQLAELADLMGLGL